MINELTKEQEAQIPVFLEKYTNLPTTPSDKDVANAAIDKLYERMGEGKPEKIWARSPREAQGKYKQYANTDKPSSNWYVSTWWISWLAMYRFGEYVGVKIDQERLSIFDDYLSNAQFIMPFGDVCFISENPIRVTYNNDNRLHNEDRAAIEFKDGWGTYALYGVRLQKDIFYKVIEKTITKNEVMGIENTEQRYAILRYNPSILLEDAELVDRKESIVSVPYIMRNNEKIVLSGKYSRHGDLIIVQKETPNWSNLEEKIQYDVRERVNELYKIDIGDGTKYFISKKCPSTDRVYYEWISTEIGEQMNADLAVAWQCGLTLEEYQNELQAET